MIYRTVTNAGDPIVDGMGRPAAGVEIIFTLVDSKGRTADGWDVLSGERIVPGPVRVLTDSTGVFSADLWPTSRGDAFRFWKCSVGIEGVDEFKGGLSEGDPISWIAFRFGGVAPTPQQYALWSLVTGGVATKAILDAAAGAYVDGQCLFVTNDTATPTNNGIWRKSGAGWIQGGLDRVTNLEFLTSVPWLDPSQAASSQWTATKKAVALAIKAVYISAPVAGTSYYITTFARNHATYKDRIIVSDANNVNIASGDGPFTPKTAGALTQVTLTGTGGIQFIFLIDYNAAGLSDGLLLNQIAPTVPLMINPFTEQQRIDARLRPAEALLVSHTTQINQVVNRSVLDNRVLNGNLSNSGQGCLYNVSPAGNYLATVAYGDLTSRGITTALKFSKAFNAALAYVYLADYTITAADAGKYFYASAYVYSEDGVNWPGSPLVYAYTLAGEVVLTGVTAGYTQITANLRRHWHRGFLPANQAYNRLYIGNAPANAGNVYMSGFTYATSRVAIDAVDVQVDQWLINGGNVTSNIVDRIVAGETRMTADEARITTLETAVIRTDTMTVNGNLSNSAQGVVLAQNPATNHLVTVAYADLTSRGITTALQFSKTLDPALVFIYKDDLLTAADAGKYFYSSVYAYSEDAVNWPTQLSTMVYPYAGGVGVNPVGLANGYVQVTANLRRYWNTGQLAAGQAYTKLRVGGVPPNSGNVYISGFAHILAATPVTATNIVTDQWLLNGPITHYGLFDRVVVGEARMTADEARITTLEGNTATLATFNPGRALRITLAGSSVTWGSGYMGEGSFLGELESRIRTISAKTVHAKDMTLSGTNSVISHNLFYGGQVLKLSGANAYAQAAIYGDELSIAFGRERKNAGAAIIELYVDGVLHDTFSTFNPLPSGSTTANFVGDGTTKLFDLGKAFTYNHVTTVGGVAKTGSLNVQGYGGTVPGGADYMVVKQYAVVGGVPQVRHWLMFAAAPANGAAIASTFDYGESVTYAKGTIGNTAQALNTSLESAYGLGSVSFDPANPSSISSGMDFRETDKRAILTWKFSSAATRTFKLTIKQLDSRATGATPELWLNFVTNRMHYFQNAGIGGWTAALLNTDTGLRTVKEIKEFNPDVVLVESGTNDDWAQSWSATVLKSGLTAADVKALGSSLHLGAISFNNPTYSVQDSRVPITAISSTSATLDGTDATFTIAAGDVIIFGDYKGDIRRTASRVVSGWNAGTRVVTWKKPLMASDFAQIAALSDLVGTAAQVRNISGWATSLTTALDSLEADLPGVLLGIVDMGIPDFDARTLIGYPEKANDLAAGRAKPCLRVKTYNAVKEWQYSQKRDVQLYLDAALSTASTGAGSYTLYKSNGAAPTDYQARNFSVTVDGVERMNDGTCLVSGGTMYNWGAVSPLDLTNDGAVLSPYNLVFSSNLPAPGAVIVVKYSSAQWSGDETHPGTTGNKLFGEAIFKALKPIL